MNRSTQTIRTLTILVSLLMILVIHSIPLAGQTKGVVKTGADRLLTEYASRIAGKRIGLITNHTAMLSNGRHLADALAGWKDTKLVVLFGPEHGIRGDAPDGRTVNDTIDVKTGVRVYSLYGKVNKPTPEMLKDVDVLIFDIQDVGARFYTFISTLFLTMEAAAEHHIPYIVLDRPNPITGMLVEGPVRVDSLKSFVGWAPMPISHGLTVGELATMANNERWFPNAINAELTVITMTGWERSMWYDQTGLAWVKPSPNMVSLNTAIVYPGLCLLEGTNVSEGRGTERPFETIGAPWINADSLAATLNSAGLSGVAFTAVSFTPKDIPGMAVNTKYKGRNCNGVQLTITDREHFWPVRTGLTILQKITALYTDSLVYRERGFDRLAGTPVIRTMLREGKSAIEIEKSWQNEHIRLLEQRRKAFLYH